MDNGRYLNLSGTIGMNRTFSITKTNQTNEKATYTVSSVIAIVTFQPLPATIISASRFRSTTPTKCRIVALHPVGFLVLVHQSIRTPAPLE
jgi:hypothetical protein